MSRLKNIVKRSKSHKVLIENFSYLAFLQVFLLLYPLITYPGMVYDPTLSILFNYEIVKYFTVVILAYIVCVLSAQFIERFSLDAGVL